MSRSGGAPTDYRWSSYVFNAQGSASLNYDWIQSHTEYLRLGQTNIERQILCQNLFKAEIASADLAQIRNTIHKGRALGSQKFKSKIELISKRQDSSKGLGRPKNQNNRVILHFSLIVYR